MERTITITLEKARELYNSDNESLKEVALQAFSEDELACNFKNITTFKKACEALGLNYDATSSIAENIATVSKASAAMFKLNIVRKALNLGHDLHLTKNSNNSYVYYPYNPFITESSIYYRNELNSGVMEIIGKIKNKGTLYNILGGCAIGGSYAGLGYFFYDARVGFGNPEVGFLGCASKEIAQHFSKYFGMLITESKYADMVDFEIIENKYQ